MEDELAESTGSGRLEIVAINSRNNVAWIRMAAVEMERSELIRKRGRS